MTMTNENLRRAAIEALVADQRILAIAWPCDNIARITLESGARLDFIGLSAQSEDMLLMEAFAANGVELYAG